MSTPTEALDPARHASVHASAGTGKTWLLVGRMARLLLEGATPESILAITFTRKAAAEMQQRLRAELAELAFCEEHVLEQKLARWGVPVDTEVCRRARRLYEHILLGDGEPRCTTFHSFCQHLLRRFPLESGVPPGFELSEGTALLERSAWDALFDQVTRHPDSEAAQALEVLFQHFGSTQALQSVLGRFIAHRADWWAYTADRGAPVAWASERLRETLELNERADGEFFDQPLRALLTTYLRIWSRHTTKTARQECEALTRLLEDPPEDEQTLAMLQPLFLTRAGAPRQRKATASERNTLGEQGQQQLLQTHGQICIALQNALELRARRQTWSLNQAWYCAGSQLLENFQRIKLQQRTLDFADLEWQTYRLLTRQSAADWVQYKLDQRIDHILIDEFQDTNPTQWRLLLPMLEELTAAAAPPPRSVFLVGDAKQSIYRFRRADARLLGEAGRWLQQRADAAPLAMHGSWRSAPVIVESVNKIFSQGRLAERLSGFAVHSTHRQELWGFVRVLPVATAAEPPPPSQTLRNPLRTPRPQNTSAAYTEAVQLARQLHLLVDDKTAVLEDGRVRALEYGDILILLRNRTHAGEFERALREQGIPYVGAERGTLLQSIEVSDMESLLRVLTTPHDNLALAQVLRAPLFAATDDDLVALARAGEPQVSWYERLMNPPVDVHCSPALMRARETLSKWQSLAGKLPVHDLLDRIYFEADVLRRYHAALPASLRTRARANLQRFLELALELDSGRYPSLDHFLAHVRQLRAHVSEAPDQPPARGLSQRVRLMTIHAAKGLEAPMVVLADCAGAERGARAYEAMVDWPAAAERPSAMLLLGRRELQDQVSSALRERHNAAQSVESANLLYVALTRARQYLIISANGPDTDQAGGWYDDIRAPLTSCSETTDQVLTVTGGEAPPLDPVPTPPPSPAFSNDPRLQQPVDTTDAPMEITPSELGAAPGAAHESDADARLRGIAIHRALELLGDGLAGALEPLARQVAEEVGMPVLGPLQQWLAEAQAVFADPMLRELLVPGPRGRVFNEIPIHAHDGTRAIVGVIDRMIVEEDQIRIFDYKSHRGGTDESSETWVHNYAPQLRAYARAVRLCWPDRSIRAWVILTARPEAMEVPLE